MQLPDAPHIVLRRIMEENGWRQKDVGEMVNRSEAAVSRWLAGKTCPDLRAALELEERTGIPARAWLNGDPTPGDTTEEIPAAAAAGTAQEEAA